MLIGLLTSGNYINALIMAMSLAFVIFVINPVHEYAHAVTAYKLGDKTAKYAGRLTMNPLASLDLIGALLLVLVGFGWAKPVPVNPRNFKNPKVGMAITAAMGPISNIILAFASLLVVAGIVNLTDRTNVTYYIALAFSFIAQINIILAVFNLIPLPPLDGSRVLFAVLPDSSYNKLMQYERYLSYGIFALLILSRLLGNFGIDLFAPLDFLEDKIYNGLYWVAELPFRLFA